VQGLMIFIQFFNPSREVLSSPLWLPRRFPVRNKGTVDIAEYILLKNYIKQPTGDWQGM
jgi:hypothetical protein